MQELRDDKDEIALLSILECIAAVLRTDEEYISQSKGRRTETESTAARALAMLETKYDAVEQRDRLCARHSLEWAIRLENPAHQFRQIATALRIERRLVGHAAALVAEAMSRNFIVPQKRDRLPHGGRILVPMGPSPTERGLRAWLLRDPLSKPIAVYGSLELGRSPSSHIVLMSEPVSRRHAQVWPEGEKVFIKDLGSTNGTFVNDQQVQSEARLLKTGDEIKIGDDLLRLEMIDVQDILGSGLSTPQWFERHHGVQGHFVFWDYLKFAWHEASSKGTRLSFMFIQLDDFEELKTIFGDRTAERFLDELKSRLLAHFPIRICLTRLKGSLFGLLVDHMDKDELLSTAEGFLSLSHARPFNLQYQSSPPVPETPSGTQRAQAQRLSRPLLRAVCGDMYDLPLALWDEERSKCLVDAFERYLEQIAQSGAELARAEYQELLQLVVLPEAVKSTRRA